MLQYYLQVPGNFFHNPHSYLRDAIYPVTGKLDIAGILISQPDRHNGQ
jgi:hypothetical protein